MSLYHQPWPPSSAIAAQLDPSDPVEEEKTPYYTPERFYPARLGQILNKRYQLATKVGYGSSSTVWLARDLQRFVHILVNLIESNLRVVGAGQKNNMSPSK
jgi:serine/threonine-protein kinase SRPK3